MVVKITAEAPVARLDYNYYYNYYYYLGCFAQPAAPIVQLDNSLRSVWQLLESL